MNLPLPIPRGQRVAVFTLAEPAGYTVELWLQASPDDRCDPRLILRRPGRRHNLMVLPFTEIPHLLSALTRCQQLRAVAREAALAARRHSA